jgi:hypothetical protein
VNGRCIVDTGIHPERRNLKVLSRQLPKSVANEGLSGGSGAGMHLAFKQTGVKSDAAI